MKKMWMAMVLLLALLVPVAQAEQAPEERVTEIAARTAYILDYDWERLPDWSAREYLEAPGTVAALSPLTVVCGGGTSLELLEVQYEGSRRMAAADFLRGHPMKVGERLQ